MATLKKSDDFQTSFVVQRDVEDIQLLVERAAGLPAVPGAPLTVFFLGEAHNNDFDVERRKRLIDALVGHKRVVLAVERTLVATDLADNVVVEPNLELRSSDDARNKLIVGLVEEQLGKQRGANTLVFFYGQEHESHICRHLLASLDKSLGLLWTSCWPMEMALARELSFQPSLFSTKGKKPVGYCENHGTDYLLRLLEKGFVKEPFNVDLYSGENKNMLFTKSVYAIYFKNDTFTAQQRKLVGKEGSAGVSIKRINGAYTVVAKVIPKDKIDEAEQGKLDV